MCRASGSDLTDGSSTDSSYGSYSYGSYGSSDELVADDDDATWFGPDEHEIEIHWNDDDIDDDADSNSAFITSEEEDTPAFVAPSSMSGGTDHVIKIYFDIADKTWWETLGARYAQAMGRGEEQRPLVKSAGNMLYALYAWVGGSVSATTSVAVDASDDASAPRRSRSPTRSRCPTSKRM